MYKDIHVGFLISELVKELNIEESRITKYFNVSEERIRKMYESESMDTFLLLKWSKILEYDFFRLYSQHLILYAPNSNAKVGVRSTSNLKSVPQFRKSIYTTEIIDFILELIHNKEKTKKEIVNEYNIPKTTLYRWMNKYEETRESKL